MKMLSKPLLMLLLCLTTAVCYSQQPIAAKPRIFANFPDKIDVSNDVFAKVFAVAEGQEVAVAFGSGLTFTGVVLSNDIKYSNLQSVTIRSATFNDALLSISKITNADNTISYTGRIINNKAFDGYEIKRVNTGYKLQKTETGIILQDCSYN